MWYLQFKLQKEYWQLGTVFLRMVFLETSNGILLWLCSLNDKGVYPIKICANQEQFSFGIIIWDQ